MARLLKQSTAFTFRVGPFVDDTDFSTLETALTIAQADLQISKDGGAFAQTSASPTTTHDTDGWYQCPLTVTDTATLGPLTVQITVSGALPVWEHFMVVPANVYDSLVAGSDKLEIDLQEWNGATVDTSILYPDGFIHFDSTASNTNTTLGVDGTFINPVSSTAAARTLALALGTKAIKVRGILQPAGGLAYTGITFQGWSDEISKIDFSTGNNSENFDDCHFVDLWCFDVEMYHHHQTVFRRCRLEDGTLIFDNASDTVDMHQCELYHPTSTLKCLRLSLAECRTKPNQTTVLTKADIVHQLKLNRYVGNLQLTNYNTAGNQYIHMMGGKIEIPASCTAGTLYLSGWGTLTDNNGGMTVNTDAWQPIPMDVDAATIADSVWDELTSGHTTSGTFGEQCKTDIDAILEDTTEIGVAGAGLTEAGGDGDHLTEAGGDGDHLTEAGGTGDQLTDLGGMSTAMKAEVEAEATDALNAYDPPTKAELDTAETNIISEIDANETKIDSVQLTLDGVAVTVQNVAVSVDAVSAQVQTVINTLPHGFKKNTAFNNFEVLMVNNVNHVTPETGKTVTAQKSIDGGAFTDCDNTPCTEVSDGIYKIDLTADDMNGDIITFKFSASDCDVRYVTIKTEV